MAPELARDAGQLALLLRDAGPGRAVKLDGRGLGLLSNVVAGVVDQPKGLTTEDLERLVRVARGAGATVSGHTETKLRVRSTDPGTPVRDGFTKVSRWFK